MSTPAKQRVTLGFPHQYCKPSWNSSYLKLPEQNSITFKGRQYNPDSQKHSIYNIGIYTYLNTVSEWEYYQNIIRSEILSEANSNIHEKLKSYRKSK